MGTPRKVTLDFKEHGKTDKSFCAMCHCDTDEIRRRRLLFTEVTNVKTETCLQLENFLNETLTLEKDTRVLCKNCDRRLDRKISTWKEEKIHLAESREKLKERATFRVKRGIRPEQSVGKKSVKSLVSAFESIADVSEFDDKEDQVNMDGFVKVRYSFTPP